MASWIIGGVLLMVVGTILWKMIKDRRAGKGACACGGDCSRCKGCH